MESDKLLKYGYGLSVKALWPTNLEKQNVKLVMQVFSEYIVQELTELGSSHNLSHYQGTSHFIDIIVKWWKIVNVRTPNTGVRRNDRLKEPFKNCLDFR